MSPEEAFQIILSGTREHTRILLPWNELPANYSVQENQKANEAITKIYQTLIQMRKADKTLVYGDFKVLNKKKNRFVYSRKFENCEYIVDCNLGKVPVKAYSVPTDYELVFYEGLDSANKALLGVYECRIWKNK